MYASARASTHIPTYTGGGVANTPLIDYWYPPAPMPVTGRYQLRLTVDPNKKEPLTNVNQHSMFKKKESLYLFFVFKNKITVKGIDSAIQILLFSH